MRNYIHRIVSVISTIFLLGIVVCQAEKQPDIEEPEQNTVLEENAEPESTGRIKENVTEMGSDHIKEYVFKDYGSGPCNNYKTSIDKVIFDELKEYFPNLQVQSWDIAGEYDDKYTARFSGSNHSSDTYQDEQFDTYTGKFMIYPDFAIEVIEDTIQLHPEKGFCTYATGELYLYHGCRMEECKGSYYNSAMDVQFDVSFPIFYTEGDEWEKTNTDIWEGLEEWVRNTGYRQGTLTMNYEIETLDNNFISILFTGEFDSDGEKEAVEMGLTVSLGSEKRLPCSMFIEGGEQDTFCNYYIKDDILFSIVNENGNWKETGSVKIDWTDYSIHRMEKHVYNENGRWLGNCYYEVPVIVTYPEEYKTVARSMREDAGRFLNQIQETFEEIVLLQDGDEPYASDYDYLSRDAETDESYAWYQCHVATEVTYNNGGILEITYHFENTSCGKIEEREAVARYDLNTGEILAYEDWQSEVLEEMTTYLEDRVSRPN